MKNYIDTNNKIWGFDDTQTALIPAGAVEIPRIYTFDQFPYLTLVNGAVSYDKAAHDAAVSAEQITSCKTKAQELLKATDWATLSDVTTGSPKLTNQEEFLSYRSALRDLAVNPVENPAWPTSPVEAWE